MRLSVLDQSPIPDGFTAADALRNTVDLAKLADRLGYLRYWIAEHHAIDSLASPAPEILLARIGAETNSIRIGSGGVMLPHYSPLKVAEVFRMLYAMYPNRVDLGIGRAPGGTPMETYALRRDRPNGAIPDDFPEQLVELIAFLSHDFPEGHPFGNIHVSPDMPGKPEVWLLGSSPWSASASAQLGLPYAFAHFIGPQNTTTAIDYYRSHFTPSRDLSEPYVILALGVICADTDEEANHVASSSRLMYRWMRQGITRKVPSVEEVLAQLGPDGGENRPGQIVGSPSTVVTEIQALVDQLHADEVMVVTIAHDHQARRHSYELLAEAFKLEPRDLTP
jgi:luciferase family oxidoreductase group 1